MCFRKVFPSTLLYDEKLRQEYKIAENNPKTVTVGLIQTAVSEDLNANLKKTIAKVEEAAQKGAQIICLQELYRTIYFPQEECQDVAKYAETIPGESTTAFAELAKKYKVVIIVPLFECLNGKFYNSAVVINADGNLLETYHKIHVPQDPLFYEQNYFELGDLGYKIYDTAYAKIAVLICYDQWFPEAARICTLKGADIIFYPTAIGYIKDHTSADGNWHDAWKTVQRGHAITNGVHVAAVNRVGEEGELEFWGGSFVCNAFGEILAEAGNKEETIMSKVDLGFNKRIRDGWGFLRNRRPDTYKPLTDPTSFKTPVEQGYRMPAEWEKHDAIWLSWPHDPVTFPDCVEKVEETYVQIIKEIHTSENVNLFVKDEEMKQKVTCLLQEAGVDFSKVRFFIFEYADVWFRDYGPTFVINDKRELAMVNWIFNTWGDKYDTLLKDKDIPQVINKALQLPCFKPRFVMEGGSIDVNGKGTLLTTEQCLLNPNRNPDMTRADIEKYLKDHLGITDFIWLKNGICGDDTDGHIDDLARFVNPTTIVCAYEEDPNDENYAALNANYELLTEATDQDGNYLNIVKLPMPGKVTGCDCRLPASYTNFYIGNTKVLVPIFNHKNDTVALEFLQKLFPTRKVVGINCQDLVNGFGTIHCISQQQPSTKR
ncbi:MAG: agmatine deiminase family protein [Candidatus Bathyarchaeia archaeon]